MSQGDIKRKQYDKFVLRLPDGMRGRISDEAKIAQRSMNMEIIHRLSSTFEADVEIRQLKTALEDSQETNRALKEELARLERRALPEGVSA